MAIIKIKMEATEEGYPEYCILKSQFLPDPDTEEFITIGLGGGTELTKAELVAYALDVHSRHPFGNSSGTADETKTPITSTNKTNAEVETMVNDWCTARNAS